MKPANGFINISVKTKSGEGVPILELPSIKKAAEIREAALDVAERLTVNDGVINEFKTLGRTIDNTAIKKLIAGLADVLLRKDILSIRDTKRQPNEFKDSLDKLTELSKTLQAAQTKLERLTGDVQTTLDFALASYNLDRKILKKLVSCCSSVERRLTKTGNRSPYYLPLFNAFESFHYGNFEIVVNVQNRIRRYNSEGQPEPITKSEWLFFKKIVTRICNHLFQNVQNPPSLEDTAKGLKKTFEHVKERKAKSFESVFSDAR